MVSRVTRACAGQATCAGQKLLAAVGVTAGGERCGTRCCTQGVGHWLECQFASTRS